ncbi:hypothetical protein T492DRAFT_882675, partial [Pavlovales sp. CCMP2436]
RPFPCDEPGCEYRATTTGSLKKRHTRTHSGERPATEVGHLKTHKHTHSGERLFPCDEPGCEVRAAVAGSLKRHKHTHSCAERLLLGSHLGVSGA